MPLDFHENLIPLESKSIIWRYMDLEKFESLLRDKALFFCRADKFSDPFEGSIPKRESEHRIKEEKIWAAYFGQPFDLKKAEENVKATSDHQKRLKGSLVANCWHINKNESDAMWRLYLKDNEGVAIQSTVEKIYAELANVTDIIRPSKIRYLDYEEDVWFDAIDYPHTHYNFLVPFIHKRKEFMHENEFRLFIEIPESEKTVDYWDNQSNHKGKLVPIDVNGLVDKIILPPTSDDKTDLKIKELTKKYSFDFTFEKSKLNSEPYF